MGLIDNIKEQRQQDKEETIKAFHEAKEYTKESFSKENRHKRLEANKARLLNPELQEFSKTQYKTHIQLMLAGVICLIIGMFITPFLLGAVGLFVGGLACMATNWKRINEENNIRKNIK